MATSPPVQKKPEVLNFHNIRGDFNSDLGIFRINGVVFGWRNPKTKEVIELKAQFVDELEWVRYSQRDYGLVVTTTDRDRYEFVGFRDPDFEVLSSYMKRNWRRNLTLSKHGCKGWHWGQYSLKNKRFRFDVDGRKSFEIPLKELAAVNTSRSDLSIELRTQDISQGVSEDQLVEIRFCVPPLKEGDPIEKAEMLKASLLDLSGLAGSDSDMITMLAYKQCSMPPGRFDVQFYFESIKLHGKSSDFTVSFDNINEIYLLPSSIGGNSFLILSLLNPLKKGQTKYPAVITALEDKREFTHSINLTEEQMIPLKKAIPELKHEMTAVEHQLTGDLLSALSGQPILGISNFKGSNDYPCFECSHKIASGLFYPLQDRFVFIPKPFVIVKFDEIASVDFGRTQGQQTRLFEFQLTLKNGTEIEFSSVQRRELQPFKDFILEKGLKIRSMTTISREDRADMDEENEQAAIDAEDDEDESDEVYSEEEEDY